LKVFGDVTVKLPFTLDFCAKGPDVDPIALDIDDLRVTVYFPPSMSDGTIGKSFFPSGWAWWTGSSLRITLERSLTGEDIDVDSVRAHFVAVANITLRRLLNGYRTRFHRPQIYPVLIDPKELALKMEYDEGSSESLPESHETLFYRSLPSEAPLDNSINSATLNDLAAEIARDANPDVREHTLLDAEWLESVGEIERAAFLRSALLK